jgi:hypothetical protein
VKFSVLAILWQENKRKKQNQIPMKRIFTVLLFSIFVTHIFAQAPLTTATDFTVTTTSGKTFKLFDTLTAGKYVCVDFFYTTCSACQATAPFASQAYSYFGCNSSNIYFIGIDQGDNTTEVNTFDQTYGVEYPTVSGTDGAGDPVVSAYQITAFPTYILIAPNHQVVEQDMWPINAAQDLIDFITPNGPTQHACPSTGIHDVKAPEGDLNSVLYPNPASDKVMIRIKGKKKENLQIRITGLNGDIVMNENYVVSPGKTLKPINVSQFANGIYQVSLINEDGIINEKLIVTHK